MHYFAVFTEKDGIYLLKLRKFEETHRTIKIAQDLLPHSTKVGCVNYIGENIDDQDEEGVYSLRNLENRR